MSTDRNAPLLRWVDVHRKAEWSDADLIAAFRSARDESAFEAIVRRHGPMVLGVCRRMLRHAQDAEDAYQAVFLVLARRIGDIHQPDLLGNWLYGVAIRTAAEARSRAYRRSRERQVDMMPERAAASERPDDSLKAVLDEELGSLPEKLRSAVLLCDIQGKTREEAATQLGVPVGTLSGRLTTAHRQLASRLARRGVTVSGAALAAALSAGQALEAAPPGLLNATVQSSVAASVHGVAGSGASAPVAALAEAILTGIRLARWKLSGMLLLLALLIAAPGLALARYYIETEPTPEPPPAPILVAQPIPVPPPAEPPINDPIPKEAESFLANDMHDIFVVSDQDESLVDYFRNNRVYAATLPEKDLQRLANSNDRWVSVSMSISGNTDARAARGTATSAAVMPLSPAARKLLAKVASRSMVTALLRNDRQSGIYDVIGYTDRPATAFFTSDSPVLRSGAVAQKDLSFVHPLGPNGAQPQKVLTLEEIKRMPWKFGHPIENDLLDLCVFSDKKEPLIDFFQRNRIAAATIFVSDYRRLCRTDEPWLEIPVAPLSVNDQIDPPKRKGRTAKVARPPAGLEIQVVSGWLNSAPNLETITMFLKPDPATDVYTLVGHSTHRASFQFFERPINVDKAGRLRQTDLRYRGPAKD